MEQQTWNDEAWEQERKAAVQDRLSRVSEAEFLRNRLGTLMMISPSTELICSECGWGMDHEDDEHDTFCSRWESG